MTAQQWVIPLPYTTPPLTANGREHWRTRARITADIRNTTHAMTRTIPALTHITVTLHYRPRDRRRRDSDNLYPILKACCDGIVDAGVVPDDIPQLMTKHAPVIDEPSHTDPRLYLVIDDTSRESGRP